MRNARIKEPGAAYYHIISRVVDRRMVFNDEEKERFCRTVRAAEAFSGVHILTHAVLSNHFHILLYVPKRQEVSDAVLGVRLRSLYGQCRGASLAAELAQLRQDGRPHEAEAFKARYTVRMYDVSEFAKTLKQRVSMSYNQKFPPANRGLLVPNALETLGDRTISPRFRADTYWGHYSLIPSKSSASFCVRVGCATFAKVGASGRLG